MDAHGKEQIVQSTHKPRHTKLLSTRKKNRLVKRLIVITIFAAAFLVFLFFLRYLTTERMPQSNSGAMNSTFAGSNS